MNPEERRAELGRFLKSRRAAVSPETVKLPRGRRRLTPGLRREEVAELADVGVTWYTWLEQGRQINVSAAAYSRIANALRLSETDKEYLFSLAGIALPAEHAAEPAPPILPPAIQVLLDRLRGPGFVTDEIFDVVAFNAIADALYDFDNGLPPFPRNHIWNALMNPTRRRLFVDKDGSLARATVGAFRLAHAKQAENARFERLMAALMEGSPEFADLWKERRTAQLTPRTTQLFHPDFGPLEVFSMRFPIEGANGHMLVVPTPANEETAAAFDRAARGFVNGARSRAVPPFKEDPFKGDEGN